jgi:hypothetical protein
MPGQPQRMAMVDGRWAIVDTNVVAVTVQGQANYEKSSKHGLNSFLLIVSEDFG